MSFKHLKVGDRVVRMLAGKLPMDLKVTKVEGNIITCGWWTFDMETGAEIDEDLGWGPPPKWTGSYLVKEKS